MSTMNCQVVPLLMLLTETKPSIVFVASVFHSDPLFRYISNFFVKWVIEIRCHLKEGLDLCAVVTLHLCREVEDELLLQRYS